ncbi:hypothetical protein [Streptomyces sp. NPDC059564]|uniref:hypothetical protein n=1 Tax=Streptomyces sp. NPDC059564 TaxID=3346865 RepID=UPI00368A0F09
MGEQPHEHGSVKVPGGPRDADGLEVDEELLGVLMGAAYAGCRSCMDRLLGEVAADPVTLGRLVVVARQAALRVHQAELPGHMTDDAEHFGPAALEFKRVMRAVTAAEPVAEVCEQLGPEGRRAAAGDALDKLMGMLLIAQEEGFAPEPALSALCCGYATVLVEWVLDTAPMARREYADMWRRWALRPSEASLPGTSTTALALMLGSVLDLQARQDGVPATELESLVISRVLSVLRDPEQARAALAGFVAPESQDIAGVTVPVKRLARTDAGFLADLCLLAAHTIDMNMKDCPYGLRESNHECTLGHRAPALTRTAPAHVGDPTPEAGRRVALPTVGYHAGEITEDAPPGQAPDHVWQINVGRILVERWDAGVHRWNEAISEDSSISEPAYQHETGLETLACPACGSREHFLVEGRWGDPLTLHCRCGVTIMSPSAAGPDDVGRRILKRLILAAADPASTARLLMPPLAEYHAREQEARGSRWYEGPHGEDVALVEAIDLTTGDVVTALETALKPRLPERHEGRALTLLLLQVHAALSEPAVRNSSDGHALVDTVHTLVADLKLESEKWAPSRLLVTDRLKAWQAEGGPAVWQDAWTRTVEMAERHFARYRVTSGRISDGCAGLTLALYLLGSSTHSTVANIRLEDVRYLLAAGDEAGDPGAADWSTVPERWEARLKGLGHDLDSTDDPVARLWRHLLTEHPADALGDRHATALALGLGTLFGERSVYRISI